MINRIIGIADAYVPSVVAKEIRQGLNGWGFLAQFYGVHAVLAFLTLAQMAVLTQGHEGNFLIERGVFWFMMGAYFLFLVPLMSINAVSSEKQGGTIELIRMTGLGARGVVWGKWAYQALFVLIVGVSVYPYIVLYHFVSGSDVVGESLMLLFLVIGSLVVLGISVGASGYGTNHFKSLVFVAVLLTLFFGGVGIYNNMIRRGTQLLGGEGLLLLLGVGGVLMVFMLEVGAARVGSRVDGHSFVIRLLGLLLLLVPLGLIGLDIFPEFCLAASFVVIIVVPWFALMEAPVMVPGPYRKYVRWGGIGRALGRFLFYPGWATGVVYSSVMLLIFVAGLFTCAHLDLADISRKDAMEMSYVFIAIATIPFQVCLVRAIFQKHETDWAISKVIVVNVALVLSAFGMGIVKVFFGIDLTPWTSFIPSNALIYSFFGAFSHGSDFGAHQFVAALGQFVIALSLILMGQRYWSRYEGLEARALEINRSRATKGRAR
ncbi:hypothetical protein IEN85_05060 [Pelagicoccus sp. NFK12]|uniref:Uncharacterized protein n=1 Tax=Pelagicoccus enzymogenes TaxID=2773457 RepID=A0A927F7V4_9BACT|nr:hypothetical protein [Pelagicoccus enzymogenes]MBD5778851.1 hypothetical protein [Pelagicoccus enzymogenes]